MTKPSIPVVKVKQIHKKVSCFLKILQVSIKRSVETSLEVVTKLKVLVF